MPSNRNRLLASLKPEELSSLSKHLREVPIKQGELLEERGERVDLVHFPQSGMISLIVEMPEDRAVEVGTVGSEGAIGITVGLGSRISCVSALVQVSGTSLCIPAQRFRTLAIQNQHLTDSDCQIQRDAVGANPTDCGLQRAARRRLSSGALAAADERQDGRRYHPVHPGILEQDAWRAPGTVSSSPPDSRRPS